MNIWLGCTTAQWLTYRHQYFAIRDYLKDTGCTVLHDWMDAADREYQSGKAHRDIQHIFQEITTAIDQADAIIIEYTVPNFSSSHQIHYALLKKKPVLVMRLQNDNPHFEDSYIQAIQTPELVLKNYTPDTFKEVIDDFIGYTRLDQGQQRYNIVLGKHHKQYLDWAAAKYQKSRSALIKSLLDQAMQSDPQFTTYIRTTDINHPKDNQAP